MQEQCTCTTKLKPLTGNHTIAVIKGKEDHETVKESHANIIKEVNGLVKDGKITVDGKRV